ncbi:hypothetical protein AB0900_31320 [Streptomyces cellulosae]
MSAETITSLNPEPTPPQPNTHSDSAGGGAGRGGSGNTQQGPLVVVQQPRNTTPPRPAPRTNQPKADNSLRNGYAAISHSVSGETAAIGIGFLVAGPVGAIVGGAALPVLVAASMWRSRRREHDENSNSGSDNGSGSGSASGSGGGRSGSGSGSGGGRGNGGGRSNSGNGSGGGGRLRTPKSPDGGRHKTPKTPGNGKGGLGNGSGGGKGSGSGSSGGAKNRKPKVKDPVADKLSKAGKGLADKLRNRTKNNDPKKPGNGDKTKPSTDTTDKTIRNKQPKARKDHSKDYPDDRRWRGRGHKDKTPRTDKQRQARKDSNGGDSTTATARDGLAPITPNQGGDTHDEIFDAEIVDDGLPPKPDHAPDDVIDGEVVDEDRIALVKARREKQRRRQAIEAAKRAEKTAARTGTWGDPAQVKLHRLREENQRIDHELARQNHLLALAAGTEQRRSTPVNYPVATTTPGSHTPGVAVARQIDTRGTIAYRLLLDLATQFASGLHNDADADMADHITELAALPNLCRDLAIAVREGAGALSKTAPLHPSVIKHLNNAAVSAVTAARMADTIMAVFVQAHREDIFRVMQPRIGEDRWNIRNAAGTLDAAKLRAAILSAGQRRALPAGTSNTGSAVVPAHDHTKKLVTLMKGFDRGHMVTCLSEVAGTAAGVEIVADSVTKLYRRMVNTWPTEDAVDDTVLATAAKVKNISAELRKAIKAAQRAHQRELKLNAKPRKGAKSEAKWDVVRGRQG